MRDGAAVEALVESGAGGVNCQGARWSEPTAGRINCPRTLNGTEAKAYQSLRGACWGRGIGGRAGSRGPGALNFALVGADAWAGGRG